MPATRRAPALGAADAEAIRDALVAFGARAAESGNDAAARFAAALLTHADEVWPLLAQLAHADDESASSAETLTALTEQMMPRLDLPSEAAVILARRNAERRTVLLQEFGALSGDQIGEEHSRAQNRHALAARWRKAGRIFGVPYRGQTLYPAFQFGEDGQPLGLVRRVLTALPREHMTDWEVALWWTAGNGWLHGRRPVDLIDGAPDEVLRAAERLGEPSPL